MISDTIFENPIPLLQIKDSRIRKQIDDYLPFSTGFENECNRKDTYDITCFEEIPNIMEVKSTSGEERFRVPSGLDGLVCIWQICEELKKNCELTESGIHIHVDFVDCFDLLSNQVRYENVEWMMQELDTWNYPGTYNNRGFSGGHTWIRASSYYKTLEFRICEMTFEYPVLIKRIIHANEIVRKLKLSMSEGIHKLELENLKKKLGDIRKKNEENSLSSISFSDIGDIVVKSRVKKV